MWLPNKLFRTLTSYPAFETVQVESILGNAHVRNQVASNIQHPSIQFHTSSIHPIHPFASLIEPLYPSSDIYQQRTSSCLYDEKEEDSKRSLLGQYFWLPDFPSPHFTWPWWIVEKKNCRQNTAGPDPDCSSNEQCLMQLNAIAFNREIEAKYENNVL